MSTSIHVTFNSSNHYGRVGTDTWLLDYAVPPFAGLTDLTVRGDDLERLHAAGDIPGPQRQGPRIIDLALLCRTGSGGTAQSALNTLVGTWAPISDGSTVPLVIVWDGVTFTTAGRPDTPRAVIANRQLAQFGVIRVLCSFKVPSGTVTIT